MIDDEVNIMTLQRILYLENDPAVRGITAMILESLNGLTLETCDSLMDLARKVKSFRPDVILLDSLLPGMENVETLVDLCDIDAEDDTPLIIVAATERCGDSDHWQHIGAQGVIPKPFDPFTLAESLRTVCHGVSCGSSTSLRAV